MSDEIQQAPDLTTTIQYHELDQKSDAESAAAKAKLPQHQQVEPEPAHTDLLDAIQAQQSVFHNQDEVFDELRKAHEEADKQDDNDEPEEAPDLPDTLKQFDPAKVQEVLDRYGLELADLESDPRWSQLVSNELQSAQVAEPQQPVSQEAQLQQHIQTLHQVIRNEEYFDPTITKAFTNDLAACLGFAPDSQQAQQTSELLQVAGVNLISTLAPRVVYQYLPQMIESMYPGLSQMYQNAVLGNTWDEVKASDETFAQLPDYGSKEFRATSEAIHKANRWVDSLEFPDLPVQDAIRAKANIMARLMSGERLNAKTVAAEVRKAFELGEKKATRTQTKVVAAKTLGAGKSKGAAFTGSADTSFRDAIVQYMKSQKTGGSE